MMVKIGPVEMTEQDAENLYVSEKYLVTYSRVYQIFYSAALANHYYGLEVVYKPGMVRRGEFIAMTGAAVNELIGQPILR